MSIISLISEEGIIEVFKKRETTDIHLLEKGSKILLKTYDEKEFLGIYINFDNKWESLKLRALQNEIILNIPLRKVIEIYQKI